MRYLKIVRIKVVKDIKKETQHRRKGVRLGLSVQVLGLKIFEG